MIYPQGSNTVVYGGNGLIEDLKAGTVVGPEMTYIDAPDHWWNAAIDQTPYAELADQANFGDPRELGVADNFAGETAYIGFALVRGGQSYYGWMEVQNPFFTASGAIVSWACANKPNMPIVAGAGLLMPVTPPRIVRPGNLRLNWQSEVGQAYQVQFKDQLDALSWSNSALTIIATATNISADISMNGTAGFYRVIQVP